MRLAFATLGLLLVASAALAQSVVPVRAIRGQTIIGPDDVALADAAVPGALDDLAEAIGREARITLYPGRPILAAHVGAPALVDRNQLVRMSYKAGALSIVTDGRALDRAAVGEPVRVMNLSSRQIVSGLVSPTGTVEVGP